MSTHLGQKWYLWGAHLNQSIIAPLTMVLIQITPTTVIPPLPGIERLLSPSPRTFKEMTLTTTLCLHRAAPSVRECVEHLRQVGG